MCIKVKILTHNIHLSPHYNVHFSFSKIRPWNIFWLIVQFQHWFICKASCILSKLWSTSVEGLLDCWTNIVGGPEEERASDSLPSLVLRSPTHHWRRSAGTDSCNSTRLDWVSHFVLLNRYSDAVSLKKGFCFVPFQSLTSSEPWFERVKLLLSSVDCYTSEYFLQKCSFPGWKGLNNLKLHQPGRSWMVLQDLWQFTHLPHTLSSNNRLLSFKF